MPRATGQYIIIVLTGWQLILTRILEDGCEVDEEAPVAEPNVTARPVGLKRKISY